MRKSILFCFLGSFFVLGFFTVSADYTSAATLTLSPQGGNITTGEILSVNILLNTEGASIDAVDIYRLNYDPSLFDVQDENSASAGVQIAPGTLMPNTFVNSVDTVLGKIAFSQLVNPGTSYTNNSNATLATIRFRAKILGQAQVTFDFISGSTVDTNVTSSLGSDILSSVINGLYILQAPQDVTAPTISNVSSSGLTQTQATISWTTDESSTTHLDYGLTTSYGSSSILDASLVRSHTVSLSGLSAGTTYNYRVRSRDASGNESISTNHMFTTQTAQVADTSAPASIINIASSNITETSADLSWTATGDDDTSGTAVLYDIRYSQTSITDSTWSSATQVTGEPAPKVSGSSENFSLVGLSSAIEYFVAIRVTDEAGNISALSNVVAVTTAQSPGNPPPPDPKVILVTPGTGQCFTHGSAMDISWTIENADHVALYVTTDGGIATPGFGNWFFMQDAGQSSVISYSWTVPDNIDSDTVRIYAEAHNVSHTTRLAIDALDANISIKPSCSAQVAPPIDTPPTQAPASPSGGGGGGGGGGGHYAPTDTIAPPQVTDFVAKGADKQVTLQWKNPSYSSDWVRTLIVKKEGGPSLSAADGAIVYQGKGEEYTDTALGNGTLYYYSAYTLDRVPNYSKAVLVFATPISGVDSIPTIINTLQVPVDYNSQNMGKVVIHNDTLYIVFPSGNARAFESPAVAQSFGILAQSAQVISDADFNALILKEGITLLDRDILKALDTDGDTLTNFEENRLGTDAYNKDTDSDGYTDDVEVRGGYDPINPPSKKIATQAYIARVKGKILLQVKRRGEAWYIYPKDGKRYYLRDGEAAYTIMRFLGEGIRTKDLERIPEAGSNTTGDKALVQRMKGKILLQVDRRGEAWYIHPADGKRYYLKDGPAAYTIMRKLGVGALNEDILQIPYARKN